MRNKKGYTVQLSQIVNKITAGSMCKISDLGEFKADYIL